MSVALGVTLRPSTDAGTIERVSEITNFRTYGDLMEGMRVTAYFFAADGMEETSEVLTWTRSGAYAGGVSGTGWSLSQSGDTFRSAWTLTTQGASLSRLVIDGGPGGTVFDMSNPSSGTRGSAEGTSFRLLDEPDDAQRGLSVTYSDLIAIEDEDPVGDLYRRLTIEFQDGALLGTDLALRFLADTDNLDYRLADAAPPAAVAAAVPLPAAAWLFASALIGLIAVGRHAQARSLGQTVDGARSSPMRAARGAGLRPALSG